MKYLFILGNSSDLAFAELMPFTSNLEKIQPNLAIGECEDPQKLMKILGGTVKIAEMVDENIPLKDLIKGDFGISDFTGKIDIAAMSKNLKSETGKRFVLPKGKELTSVVVKKQKLTEIIFTSVGIFKTVAVQDFEDWGKRDYDRPQAQGHIGMLPPKVARMMINLAVSSKGLEVSRILDPFCGTGTVLAEAMMLGLKAIGSDIDQGQVERTKQNLTWLSSTYNLATSHYSVFVADARGLSSKIKEPVDSIVTEPYLGPNDRSNPNFQQLTNLYIGAMANWKNILKIGGKIVIALPDNVKTVIDEAKRIGYTLEAGPYVYARPQARVKRHICVFKFQNQNQKFQ